MPCRFDMHRPARNTDYRVVYRGELIYAPASTTKRVHVQRRLASTVTSSADGTYTLRGTVTPKVAGKIVRLQRAKCPTWCSFSTVKSTKTTSRSTWSFRVAFPTGSSWSYRAYALSDRYFTDSYSDAWSIRRQ